MKEPKAADSHGRGRTMTLHPEGPPAGADMKLYRPGGAEPWPRPT